MFLLEEKILVKDVMSDRFIILNEDGKLKEAIVKMLKKNLREVFLVDKKHNLKGVLSLTDLSRIEGIENKKEDIISKYMTSNLIYARKTDTLFDCRNIMIENKIGRLPVLENGKLVGVIRDAEVRDYFYMKMEEISVKLNHIINNIHEAICAVDRRGRVILWNKKAERLYGVKAEKIIGKKVKELFPNAILVKVLETRKEISNVYHSPREGSYVIISALPVFVNGELVGAVSTDRDVTEVKQLSQKLERANTTLNFLKNEVKRFSSDNFGSIIGRSDKLLDKIEIARQVAKTDTTVLITGESGTGKEVFARAIHEYSGRKGIFVPVNCSAIPPELFESELFGYEEGAFTGAKKRGKVGVLELANNGTLFLDEIGDMPIFMQAKLLRVLQEKEFRRVGGEKNINVNVRVISATNKDLKKMVEEGTFREDLYYRLNVVGIELPPLRERKGDVILLIHHFLKEICKRNNIELPHIDKEVINILENHKWKGNIRELKNTVEYLTVMSKDNVINKDSIPDYILTEAKKGTLHKEYPLDLNEAKKRIEIDTINRALEIAEGNKVKAAQILNIPRSTLYYKLESYGIM